MTECNNYVVFHCHTMLSNGTTIMDSVTRFSDYVNEAKKCGMTALAISEHGSVFEWKHKKDAIEAAGMKYIHAEEFYLTESIIWRTVDSANYHPENYDDLVKAARKSAKGDEKKFSESLSRKIDKALSDVFKANGIKRKKGACKVFFDERNLKEKDGVWYANYLDSDIVLPIDISSVVKERDEKRRDNYHCVLIAKNYQGFLELNKLMSISFNNDGHNYYSPRITFDELFATSDNIIISTACVASPLGKGTDTAKQKYLDFLIKNKHRVFLEVQHHDTDKQRAYNLELYELSKKYGIPMIAATDTHCLNKVHELGRKYYQLRKDITFDDEAGWDLTWKTFDQLVDAFEVQGALPKEVYMEAINNTNVMADMVEPIELDKSFKYPRISKNAAEDLYKKIYDCAREKKPLMERHTPEEIKARLDMEFETYKSIDACDYMLLEKYIVDWCHSNDIWLGPGRGSVTGALSAYAMGITEMDSLKYDLKFWRFMSKDKYSLGDIDLDHAKADREKVKYFLLHDHLDLPNIKTAEIITFNTIQLKGAIRDMGGALNMPLDVVDKIAKAVHEVTVEEEKFSTIDDSYRKKYPKLFELVDIVTGVVTSIGSHPSGVLVADRDIYSELGCCYLKDDSYPVCVLNMKELDSLNWVKWDVLGLDNVGIINNTCKLANIPRVNPDNIPEDDVNVWNSIRDDTSLIFQWNSNFGSQTMKKLFSDETIAKIKKVYPNITYIDLFSFGNALIRPCGKSQYDSAVNGEITPTGVKDIDDLLSSELNRCLFQEDIMSFVMQFCGYSFIQADKLRKCVARGTKILMGDGSVKNIEDVLVGDSVCSYSNGTNKVSKVVNWFNNGNKEIVNVKCDCGFSLKCTKDHKILTQRGYVEASELTTNDFVFTPKVVNNFDDEIPSNKKTFNDSVRVLDERCYMPKTYSILNSDFVMQRVISIEECGIETVYDIEVEDTHNFIADGVVVHNCIAKKVGTKEQIPIVKKAFEDNAKVKYNLTDEKSDEIIEPVLQCILDATRYSFSKNHAYAYSWIGYMCGYLRYYYPIEYLSSCLDIFADDDKKTNEAVAYANKLRVTILPPKFGHANANYMPDKENNAIYKGMKSIKYMNSDIANELYDIAKSRTFNSFTDVLYAIKDADIGIDTRQMKSLIQLDFFDCFGNAKELLRIYNMFNDFFKKGEASSIGKDKVEGNAIIKAIIERHSIGVTKAGKPAKSYSQLDCRAVVQECEEYLLSLGIPDFSIKDKIEFHNEYFGYIGIVTNKPEDRPRLIVTNVRPLEKDGTVWGYGVTAQSLGSGKKSDYTIYARGMTDEIKKNDVILVKKVEKNLRGYWIIKSYRIEVGI